jgi:hypothetical protein
MSFSSGNSSNSSNSSNSTSNYCQPMETDQAVETQEMKDRNEKIAVLESKLEKAKAELKQANDDLKEAQRRRDSNQQVQTIEQELARLEANGKMAKGEKEEERRRLQKTLDELDEKSGYTTTSRAYKLAFDEVERVTKELNVLRGTSLCDMVDKQGHISNLPCHYCQILPWNRFLTLVSRPSRGWPACCLSECLPNRFQHMSCLCLCSSCLPLRLPYPSCATTCSFLWDCGCISCNCACHCVPYCSLCVNLTCVDRSLTVPCVADSAQSSPSRPGR